MPKVSDEHRAARREQILQAGIGCVAAEGFHKTTMAHVIAASGLSAGAVYGYFRSKEELIAAIADRAVGTIEPLLNELLTRDPLPSPAQTVEAITSTVVGMAESGGVDITRVAMAAWAEAVRDETVRLMVMERFNRIRGRLVDLAERLQEAGRLDPDVDPVAVAQATFGSIPGFILQRLLVGDVTPQSYAVGLSNLG